MELEFRARIIETNEIFPVDAVWFNSSVCLDVTNSDYMWKTKVYGLKEVELLQYTGLKDKNGKNIFRGDIVIGRNRRTDWKERNEKVTFLNGCYMFGNWNAHEYFNGHAEIEVIGNIYENPELLEG